MTDALPPPAMDPSPPAPRRLWLRTALAAAAGWELIDSLSSTGLLFADMDLSEVFGGLGGRIVEATIALRPLAAIAALALALIGRTPHAIVAMAAVVLIAWLGAMPAFVTQRPDFDGVLTTAQTLFQIVACPLLAAMAIALATRREKLPLATIFVCLPTVVSLIGIAAFAVSVAIYGF